MSLIIHQAHCMVQYMLKDSNDLYEIIHVATTRISTNCDRSFTLEYTVARIGTKQLHN